MKNIFSARCQPEKQPDQLAVDSREDRERLARIESALARTEDRLDALSRIESRLARSSAQLDFLHTHGASYLGDGIALTHLPDETPIFINSNDYGSPMNFLSGGRYEEDNISLLLSFVDENTVFLDIGANLGFFSLRVAQRLRGGRGKVLAFEPQPRMVELLNRTLHLNGIAHAVEVHPFALSDRAGTALFEVPVGHTGAATLSSVFVRNKRSLDSMRREQNEVQLIKLDDHVPADFCCDLVKIDVEGHELEVLQGMHGVLQRSQNAGVLFEKMTRDYGNEPGLWRYFDQLGMRLYGVADAAILLPLRSIAALAAWDRGNVFASRDGSLIETPSRQRFHISARQLRIGGNACWEQDGATAVIEGRDALVFGPYWSLARGSWRMTLHGDCAQPLDILIKERVGALEVTRHRLQPGTRCFEFYCDHDLVQFECVLHAVDRQPTQLHIRSIALERTDFSLPADWEKEPPDEQQKPLAATLIVRLPDVPERTDTTLRAATSHLPRITIFSNCQGEMISSAIQALTGCRMPSVQAVGQVGIDDPSLLLGPLRELAEHNDVVLMQPLLAKLVLPLAPDLVGRIQLFPNITFSAFHPDICYVYQANGAYLEGPLGPYQSSIAYHAWRSGMSPKQAVDHFRDDVYRTLQFYSYWDSSARALCAEGHAANLPLENLLEGWRARGCFMHTHNHPAAFALIEIARTLVTKMGLGLPPLDTSGFLHDSLASGPVWPVYPEIAAQIGGVGSYVFKASNGNQNVRTPIRLFDLESFVEQSFSAFSAAKKDTLRCDRRFTSRYREVFDETESKYRYGIPPPRAAAPSTHPYSGLPRHQFWRAAMSESNPLEIDPVIPPPFGISPATHIASAGSCFAQHISRRLVQRNFNFMVTEAAPTDLTALEAGHRNYGVYTARYGNLYSARQLLQLFLRAYGEFTPSEPPWLRTDGRLADPFRPEIEPEGFSDVTALEASRAEHFSAVRKMFETVDVFVFTLGLTEAWQSAVDGAVFPLAPGVVAGELHPERHTFVNFDVESVVADLAEFMRRLEGRNPAARVLFTVSPVPLAATYEPKHVLSATTYSKSVLRVAAERICQLNTRCGYFPAYEIIMGQQSRGAYFKSDLRAVNDAGVDHVMRLFFKHYAPESALPTLDAELQTEAENHFRIVCEEERLSDAAH